MRRSCLSFLLLGVVACTAANPAFDLPGETAAGTVASETEATPDGSGTAPGMTGDETRGDGSGDSASVTSGNDESTTGEPVDDTGNPTSCQPDDLGRPLDLRVVHSLDGQCGPAVLTGSHKEMVRLPASDVYEGRLCALGCGGVCRTTAEDDYLQLHLPPELADSLAQVNCVELHAAVDHNDECRVDYIAAWFDGGMKSKAPEFVGVTEDVPAAMIGGPSIPSFQWVERGTCGETCRNGSPLKPGVWGVDVGSGEAIEHGLTNEVTLQWEGGAITGSYELVNLRSYVTETCKAQFAWVAVGL